MWGAGVPRAVAPVGAQLVAWIGGADGTERGNLQREEGTLSDRSNSRFNNSLISVIAINIGCNIIFVKCSILLRIRGLNIRRYVYNLNFEL